MINPKELRIGNLVRELGFDYNHDNKFPDGTFEDVVVDIKILRFIIDGDASFVPVPLTEDDLIKAGFRKEGDFLPIAFYHSELPGMIVHDHDPEERFFYSHNLAAIIEVKSWHHLQNLYFALTGKELPVSQ